MFHSFAMVLLLFTLILLLVSGLTFVSSRESLLCKSGQPSCLSSVSKIIWTPCFIVSCYKNESYLKKKSVLQPIVIQINESLGYYSNLCYPVVVFYAACSFLLAPAKGNQGLFSPATVKCKL